MSRKFPPIAFRNLLRNKTSTLIGVIGLSIGFSACLIIYLIVRHELSFDRFHPDRNKIYRVYLDDDDQYRDGREYHLGIRYDAVTEIRNTFSGIEAVAAFYRYPCQVVVPAGRGTAKRFDLPERPEIIVTEPEYFQIFKYKWLTGDERTALDQPGKVVLTESKARKYFGAAPLATMIGRVLIYYDTIPLFVTGIVEDLPGNTDLVFKDFVSFATIGNRYVMPFDNEQTFIKLTKAGTPARFEVQTPPVVKMIRSHMNGSSFRQVGLHLQPLADIHLNINFKDTYIQRTSWRSLKELMAAALIILTIATINFVNLSTAKSMEREREIAVRKVLGSTKMRIGVRFLLETLVVTGCATALAIFIVIPVLAGYRSLIPEKVKFSLLEPSTLFFLILINIVTAFLAGIYPSRVLSSCPPGKILSGKAAPIGGKGSLPGKGLIVFQFTVSLLFIIATLIVRGQLSFMRNKDLGFDKDAILTIKTRHEDPPGMKYAFAESIRHLIGVERVSVCGEPPEIGHEHGGWVILKKNEATVSENNRAMKVDCNSRTGDAGYIPLYGLRMVAGRNFTPPAAGEDSVFEYVINERCARELGFGKPSDAVGRIIEQGYFFSDKFHPRNSGPVTGVVADFNALPLTAAIPPVCISASQDLQYAVVSVKLSKNVEYKSILATIEKSWNNVFPTQRFDYAVFNESIEGFYESERNISRITGTAMVVAISISGIGLFGLIALISAQRTKEIGIRKVLGATVADVAGLFLKDFGILILISFTIAAPIAYYWMHGWLQAFEFRRGISLWPFVVAGLMATVISLFAIGFHVFKAAVANPVDSLRGE